MTKEYARLIERLKKKAKIVEVVGDYTTVLRHRDIYTHEVTIAYGEHKGRKIETRKNYIYRFWACCPFHGEKTPSFQMSNEKNTYECFGCKKTGNVFDFIQDIEHVDYDGAVEKLAKKYNMKMPTKLR